MESKRLYFFVAHLKLKETRFKHMFLVGESALWAIMVEEILQRSYNCILFLFPWSFDI